ncbi:transglutaminase family protein [Cellulomonas endophytica]|uniref:transglutaminase family protein n=1 Tax=Cellulomonas endophytica TaxID=2494735 RepID=UPI00101071CC|nr:transglutaminase family protein [Cellulomonas endophytica]
MSRLHVVHTSSFRYATPVLASYNEARMRPLDGPGQRVVRSRVDVTPHTWSTEWTDYWGTSVTAFEVLAPHEQLVLTAEHVVEVSERPAVTTVTGWDELRGAGVRDRFAEFLSPTPTTTVPEEVVDLARDASRGADPAEAAQAVAVAVRDALEYVPGVTTVHTPAAEAWSTRTGVCQDMAHLTVGALQGVGVPARYVSGYLHPRGSDDDGTAVTGESHAWVEWWTGAWYGYDPTNRTPVGEQHVAIGRGRSYDDVPPLRGIYAGRATQDLTVTVRITRQA